MDKVVRVASPYFCTTNRIHVAIQHRVSSWAGASLKNCTSLQVGKRIERSRRAYN